MWAAFFDVHTDTFGIVCVLAAFGSGAMLWVKSTKQPVTMSRAIGVIAAGQFASLIAVPLCFGYLMWTKFAAPLVGAICGLIGVFFVRTGVQIGETLEQRAPDIANSGIDLLKKKTGAD